MSGISISFIVEGDNKLLTRIRRVIKYSASDSSRITQEYGERLLEQVRQNASGRPGPNVITGQYRSSINITDRSKWSVTVGTNAVQAMRLEYGFVGVDAIGRSYNQGPFPHFRPAAEQIGPEYLEEMKQAVRSWWR